MEVFGGSSGPRYVSRRELEKIKKNMKKVPEIQKKSNEYHKRQAEKAEEELNRITKTLKKHNKEIIDNDYEENLSLRQKIIKRFKATFIKK